jgi:hypothetical protein
MNTDNTSISGETIDYGPCAFLDAYDPGRTFSSIDQQGGRYAFHNQPRIALWNLARLAEALVPLVGDDEEARRLDSLTARLDTFPRSLRRRTPRDPPRQARPRRDARGARRAHARGRHRARARAARAHGRRSEVDFTLFVPSRSATRSIAPERTARGLGDLRRAGASFEVVGPPLPRAPLARARSTSRAARPACASPTPRSSRATTASSR